jgi:predicted amidophosphoribosyltransferase
MSRAYQHFACSACGAVFRFIEAPALESPFSSTILLRGCPQCHRVIDEDHTVTHLRLACDHDGCARQPIGFDGANYWCADHYPIS